VPVIGHGDLLDAVEIVRKGFRSHISDDVASEGLIARPRVQMFNRAGKRIIAKVKTRDFFPNQETWHK